MNPKTYYERFELSPENRRLLRQEELIVEVTESLAMALKHEGISKSDLAERLNRTKSFVTQVLGGGRNLTLRTVADIADALNHCIRITSHPRRSGMSVQLFTVMENRSWSSTEAQFEVPIPKSETHKDIAA